MPGWWNSRKKAGERTREPYQKVNRVVFENVFSVSWQVRCHVSAIRLHFLSIYPREGRLLGGNRTCGSLILPLVITCSLLAIQVVTEVDFVLIFVIEKNYKENFKENKILAPIFIKVFFEVFIEVSRKGKFSNNHSHNRLAWNVSIMDYRQVKI